MAAEKGVPVVVNSRFVFPHATVVHTEKTWSYCWTGAFAVEDDQAQHLYKGHRRKCCLFGGPRFVLHDASDEELLRVNRKGFIHKKWVAYEGGQANEQKVLFQMKSMGWRGLEYWIYLGTNESKEEPDFRVERVWRLGCYREFVVFFHDQPIASVTKWEFRWLKSNRQLVTVNPGVDQAFIAAVLATIELIDEVRKDASA